MIEVKIDRKGNHIDFPKVGNLALVSMNLSKAKAHKVNRKKNAKKKRDRSPIHSLKNPPTQCQYKNQKIKLTTIENNPLKIGTKENLLENLFPDQIEMKMKMNLPQTKRKASENQKVKLAT